MWTKEQLAALRAGASIDDVKAMISAEVDEILPERESTGGEDEEEEVAATAEELAATTAAALEQVATLEARVAELEGTLAETVEANTQADEANTSLIAQIEVMTPAIMGMLRQRALVLGATVPDEYDTTEAMLEAYTTLEEKFHEKFKAGRQSMPTKTPSEKKMKGFDSKTLAEMKAINIPA